MALLTVFCLFGLFFALGSAQVVSCPSGQTKLVLLDVGAGAPAWKYQFGNTTGAWFTPTFNDAAWPSAPLPYSTNPSSFASCQGLPNNDCLPHQLLLTENIPPIAGSQYYHHFLRNTFTLTNPDALASVGVEVVHDDSVDFVYVNGVDTGLGLPDFHCNTFSETTTNFTAYNLVAGTNSIAVQWTNKDSAAYLHLRLVACQNQPSLSPSPSKFPESGADPYFQDSHGHGFYANTEGLMLLCKTGRYTLQGHAVAACNASFLMSTTVWENETVPLSPECTRVKLQPGEAEQIGHAMLGNPYHVIRKEFCVAEDFKYTVYYVQVKPCGLVTQYLRIYDDCEEGWMSHKTYELYQYFSSLEE